MFCEFAMVYLSFFLARDLFLNALGVEWYEVLNVLGNSLMIMLSLVLCDIIVRILEVTSFQYDRWRIIVWSFSDYGLLCKSFLIYPLHVFFQCVLVFASNRMLNSWDLVLLQSSLREWASVSKSRPLVFTNSSLVTFGLYLLGIFPNGKFYLLLLFLLVWFEPFSFVLFGF